LKQWNFRGAKSDRVDKCFAIPGIDARISVDQNPMPAAVLATGRTGKRGSLETLGRRFGAQVEPGRFSYLNRS
jgi:hypothetical protein